MSAAVTEELTTSPKRSAAPKKKRVVRKPNATATASQGSTGPKADVVGEPRSRLILPGTEVDKPEDGSDSSSGVHSAAQFEVNSTTAVKFGQVPLPTSLQQSSDINEPEGDLSQSPGARSSKDNSAVKIGAMEKPRVSEHSGPPQVAAADDDLPDSPGRDSTKVSGQGSKKNSAVRISAQASDSEAAAEPQQVAVKMPPDEEAAMTTTPSGRVIAGPRTQKLRVLLESRAYTTVSMTALAVALFGGSFFTICNIPDDPGTTTLDFLMVSVTVFFVLEVIALWIAGNGYPLSFFFWMDILGTLSMVFEISFLLGTSGKVRVEDNEINPVLLRSARAAKIGARAARLSKVVKCLNFSSFGRQGHIQHTQQGELIGANGKKVAVPECNAEMLKRRLGLSLSSKVSMLTVVLVVCTPLFSIGRFPEEDFSMKSWSFTLELDYSRAYTLLLQNSSLNTTPFFGNTVTSMRSFYTESTYFPFKVMGYNEQVVVEGRAVSIPGSSLLSGDMPLRKQDIVLQEAKSSCSQAHQNAAGCGESSKASISFDFRGPNQTEAFLDVFLILFIVACMVLESFDLSRTMDFMVVKPVEKMLGTVAQMANILNAIRPSGAAPDPDAEFSEDFDTLSEGQMLEVVFNKFAFLVDKFIMQNAEEQVELHNLATDDESRGVIMQIMGLGRQSVMMDITLPPMIGDMPSGKVVPDLPAPEETLTSWQLDVWKMPVESQNNVARYMFFDHLDSSGHTAVTVPIFFKFQELVRVQYMESNPYHNYIHACDVTAAVFRLFIQLRCREWMSDLEMYALLIAAMCHDVGHPGWTTPFLVETRHELAVRYNDSSPLENMHCSRLFEICSHEGANAFHKLEKDAYKQVRKVCINAILHTDNALHFEMVKAVKDVYEMSADICDAQAKALADVSDKNSEPYFMEQYVTEVLQKSKPLWQQLVLHLCDVSNPLRPWHISRCLATRVQDEFFRQGDEEKKLGIPVGMLNDRDKVSRSGAEHGFINFLVSPLVLATVSNFPLLQSLSVQMVSNLKEWRNLWVTDTKPTAEDIKKRDADIQKIQEMIDTLGKRKPISTVRNIKKNEKDLTTQI